MTEPCSALDLIELIYGAVVDTSRWQSVLDSIVTAVHARHGLLTLVPCVEPRLKIFRMSGWTPEEIALYSARYAAADPWRIALSKRPEWYVATDVELCSREEIESSEVYREFYKPKGSAYGMGGPILIGPAGQSIITLTRGFDDGPFGEAELTVLRPLIPHLKRGALLHGELGSMRAQLATFTGHLDRSPYPLLLTDLDCRVLYSNASARELASVGDGVAIASGCVTLGSSEQDQRLQEAAAGLTLAAENDLCRMEIPRPSGKRPLRLMVTRAQDSGALPWGLSQPSIALQIVNVDSGPAPDAARLTRLFSLTPSEARVAGGLTLGQSVEEIAAETGTSVGTIRTHLKRILSKTGTSRQGELISVILRSAAFPL